MKPSLPKKAAIIPWARCIKFQMPGCINLHVPVTVVAGNDISGEGGLNLGAYATLAGDIVSATINMSSGTESDCDGAIGHNLAVAALTVFDGEDGLYNLESVGNPPGIEGIQK